MKHWAMNAFADLLDWRRRVSDLYAGVRALRPHDPARAHAVWRAGRGALFATHPQSPIPERRRAAASLACWPYDPALAFEADLDGGVPEERLEVLSSAGHPMPLVRFGRVQLPIGKLDVYWIDVYGGGLFLPFRDATGGRESYGGGRYLLDTVKGADLGAGAAGRLILDFNFAYHPSCFHDPRWSCPLAPPSNTLRGAVRAGERVQ